MDRFDKVTHGMDSNSDNMGWSRGDQSQKDTDFDNLNNAGINEKKIDEGTFNEGNMGSVGGSMDVDDQDEDLDTLTDDDLTGNDSGFDSQFDPGLESDTGSI